MSLLRELAARVRSQRERRGYTAREAAKRAGISLRFYHSLESGRANISVMRLASVAEGLGIPLAELFRRETARPVALLGLRGAGKSTIGPKLARAMGAKFVELDELIEQAANLSLPEIFNIHGEPYYRKLESDCLQRILSKREPCVVALPGGVVRNEAAFSAARQGCVTIWLKARPEEHMRRVYLQGDRRPMANRDNAMEELKNILRDREPFYQLADVTVDTSAGSVAGSVRRIQSELARRGGG
jgi:XRE family aerobic/anaerobic benzoate catabolism transcriptional regulator